MKTKAFTLLLTVLLILPLTACGTHAFSQAMKGGFAAPTSPSKLERESHDRHTVRDWWNYAQEKNKMRCTLQISGYHYDDQSIATKRGSANIDDHDLAAGWLTRLMKLEIREVKAPESSAGERSLLELTFQDQAANEIVFISLQTCDDGSDRVFINGSFMPPEDNIPENIFLIEDHDAEQMFMDLKSLIED